MTNSLCLDASYLVGLFDVADLWHGRATEIDSLLRQQRFEVLYFDCVLNELFSTLGRRCRERKTPDAFPAMQSQVSQLIPETAVTWLYPNVPNWYNQCLDLMLQTQGRLSFHDSLITVAMEQMGFSGLVSFDTGFDQVSMVKRLGSSQEVSVWLTEHRIS